MTTTMAGSNVVEVTLTLTVDNPETITENETLTTAMVDGFAEVMNVDPEQVTLTFQVARRLDERRLQVELIAIFTVTYESVEAAQDSQAAIESISVEDTNSAITNAVVSAGFTGAIEVTGKEAAIVVEEEPPSGAAAVQSLFFLLFAVTEI